MKWLGAAAAVHVALLGALVVAPVRRGAPAPTEPVEVAITLETEEIRAPEHGTETTSTEPRATAPSPPTRATTASEHASASSGASSGEPAGAPSGSAGPPGDTPRGAGSAAGGVVPIPFSAAELGIGGRNPFLPTKEEPPPTGADHPAARAMRGTGLEHDRELGLGPEGPAIAALSDATTSSIAPLRGRALFMVRTGNDGLVASIELLDSEGGAGWGDAGKIALERLRGKKLAIPRGATAMNMRIEVRSEMKLPNGQNAPVGTRLGDNNMPELTIPDLSNVGQKPRRVVHARAAGTDLL